MKRSPSTRAGMTLWELALELTVLAALASMTIPLIRDLMRATPQGALTAEGQTLDATCDQLRRELDCGGVRLDGPDLLIGSSRWHHDADTLSHDGALRLTACAVAWECRDGWWQVTLTPKHGPARSISSRSGPTP